MTRQGWSTAFGLSPALACGALAVVIALGTASGCKTEHKVTVDHRISGSLDINIKVDRELDRFFAFEDDLKPAPTPVQEVKAP
jgi:hypothetical protein